MRINEVFCSLQGEGVNAGLPTVFVRFQGCNLKPFCCWCDTKYAQTDGDEELTLKQLMERITKIGAPTCCERFCITGGEPLRQELEVIELVQELQRNGVKNIEIFTNGSLPVPVWYERVQWCVDVKCPSSRTQIRNNDYDEWFRKLRPNDSVKFVVADKEDLRYCEFMSRSIDKVRGPQVLVSPMLPNSPDSQFGEVLMSSRPWLQTVWNFCVENNVRWSFQQHKLAFGNKRGI